MGTGQAEEKVRAQAQEAGFRKVMPVHPRALYHDTIDGLRLQIHPPSSLRDIGGIITQVDFDDLTEKIPQHPEAIESLRSLYERLSDLQYITDYRKWLRTEDPESRKLLISPLSKYFE